MLCLFAVVYYKIKAVTSSPTIGLRISNTSGPPSHDSRTTGVCQILGVIRAYIFL